MGEKKSFDFGLGKPGVIEYGSDMRTPKKRTETCLIRVSVDVRNGLDAYVQLSMALGGTYPMRHYGYSYNKIIRQLLSDVEQLKKGSTRV